MDDGLSYTLLVLHIRFESLVIYNLLYSLLTVEMKNNESSSLSVRLLNISQSKDFSIS